ncbi:MAG: ABC transporter permease [Acidobacteria bacterium]|nr:ABC transporter permease [Acidobacteriota bacterium]
MRRVGWGLLIGVALLALAAPLLTPHTPGQRFVDRLYAPPMRPHILDADGRWHAPFVYPVQLADRLERRYEEDRAHPVPLRWFSGGVIVDASSEDGAPWLPLGADGSGRDVFARLAYGARLSLGVALVATLGALLIGTLVGGAAGVSGGLVDDGLMRLSDFVVVLPAMYVVLALRAAMPLVLETPAVFALVAGIMAVVGWPLVARGVRAIVAAERDRDYAQAARSLGMGRWRLLVRHLLPAARGYLATQATLLLPGFILAEATLSYVGLGFPDPDASWGSMLQEAATIAAIADAPWTLAPAVAIFAVVLAVNLIVQTPEFSAVPGLGARSDGA